MNLAAAALALVIERFAGYPAFLQNTIGHPVQWMGRAIDWLDHSLNTCAVTPAEQRWRGIAALAVLVIATIAITLPVSVFLRSLPGGWFLEALLATAFLAQKSLHDHVRDVADAGSRSREEARASVSRIVGRDPASLDESGIARAALESLAENASDGVVAPALWFAVGGLPAIAAYKAINTADSMIGHRSERHLHFGWASARLDDLVNLPASRLTALLIAAAAAVSDLGRARAALRCMWRDAAKHQSPNAGWPEAAMAGALDIQLGGPRSYGGASVDLPAMGEGRISLNYDDIGRGLQIYSRAMWLLAAALLLLAMIG